MNNQKYYNGVSSYDFSLFTSRESTARKLPEYTEPRSRQRDGLIEIPELREGSTRASRRRPRVFPVVLLALFVLLLVAVEIYLRAEITGLKSETAAVQKEISALDSRETGLQMEFEQKISYGSLEEAAGELGMGKPGRDQVIYLEPEE